MTSGQGTYGKREQMLYGEAFSFVFRNPRWVYNLLLLAVTNLVPLIGGIVGLGYQARVIESLRRGGRGQYHDYDFEQLTDYLLRGLRVFLVLMVVLLLIVPFYLVFLVFMAVVLPFFGSNESGAASSIAGCLLGTVIAVGVLVVVALVLLIHIPLQLRSSLHSDVAACFSPRFVRDFIARVGGVALVTYLLLMVVSIPVAFVGMLFLIVGVFPAMAYIQLVQAHLLAQLADLYEARGGEPVGNTGAAG
jgi:hypothetical protein